MKIKPTDSRKIRFLKLNTILAAAEKSPFIARGVRTLDSEINSLNTCAMIFLSEDTQARAEMAAQLFNPEQNKATG